MVVELARPQQPSAVGIADSERGELSSVWHGNLPGVRKTQSRWT